MQIYFAIFFTIVSVVTAVLQIWPKTKVSEEQPYVLPMLTMMAISLVALLAPQPVNLMYKGAILLGLLLSLLAVLFFTMPKTPPYIATSHLLIVYFVYFLGFASAWRLAIPSPILLLIIAYGGFIFWFAKELVKEQWGALLAYIITMAFMVWAASELWVQNREFWATAAFAGALLLVISNSILLLHSTRRTVKWVNAFVAIPFYLGQCLIAWSVWSIVELTLLP